MAAFECPVCHQQRSRMKNGPCNVCWLLADLEAEHTSGSHKGQPQPSCVSCREAHAQKLPKVDFTERPLSSLVYHDPGRQRRTEAPATASLVRVTSSHATCKHERTPKARAKCRAERKVAS